MKEIIATLAAELQVSPNSLKKWKARRAVPHKYRLALIEAAARRGEELTAADLDWNDKPDDQRAAA